MSGHAILIAQDEQQTRLAFEVHRNADLSRIRLARSRVESAPLEEFGKEPLSLDFRFRPRREKGTEGLLRLAVHFQMAAKARDSGKPVVRVEAVFEADYELAQGFQPTDEQVKAFQGGNAIFNVWPYFREYLQTTLVRMSLPPLTAPFLRLVPKPPRRRRAAGRAD